MASNSDDVLAVGSAEPTKDDNTWFVADRGYFFCFGSPAQDDDATSATPNCAFNLRDDLNDALASVTRRMCGGGDEEANTTIEDVPHLIIEDSGTSLADNAGDDTSLAYSSLESDSIASLSRENESLTWNDDSSALQSLKLVGTLQIVEHDSSSCRNLEKLQHRIHSNPAVNRVPSNVLMLSPKIKSTIICQAKSPPKNDEEDVEVTFDKRGHTRVDGKVIGPVFLPPIPRTRVVQPQQHQPQPQQQPRKTTKSLRSLFVFKTKPQAPKIKKQRRESIAPSVQPPKPKQRNFHVVVVYH